MRKRVLDADTTSLILPPSISEESIPDYPFSMILLKSRSRAWNMCVALCKKATYYHEKNENIIIGFNESPQEFALFEEIISVSRNWKNIFLFVNGKLQKNIWQIESWLKCYKNYQENTCVDDYCKNTYTHSYLQKIIFISPCRRINDSFYPQNAENFMQELHDFVLHWGLQNCPNFDINRLSIQKNEKNTNDRDIFSNDEDSLYVEVVRFVREQGKVSISLIQRHFRIGFNRAARFVQQMEQDGIIKPRTSVAQDVSQSLDQKNIPKQDDTTTNGIINVLLPIAATLLLKNKGGKSPIPGLSFSLSRALGISAAKGRLSKQIGIPLTASGRQRKIGRMAGCLLPIMAVVFLALGILLL